MSVVNEMFSGVFPTQVIDESISQMEYTRFNEVNGLDLQNFSGPLYKITTKDLDSYLDMRHSMFDLVYTIRDANEAIVANAETAIHSNVMSIFSKASYFMNSVEVDSFDLCSLSSMKNWLEYSDDYMTKRGTAEGFFLDKSDNAGVTGSLAGASTRTTLSSNKKVHHYIPANRVFNLLNAYGAASRGIEHRFEFILEQTPARYLFGTNAATGTHVKIESLSLWVPKVVPAKIGEEAYLAAIASKSEAIINYDQWTGYRQLQQATQIMNWNVVTSSGKKPKYVLLSLQSAARLDSILAAGTSNAQTAAVNPAIFDSVINGANIRNVSLKLNSTRYPLETYQPINLAAATAALADNYYRVYSDFTRLLGEPEMDNGGLIEANRRNATSTTAYDGAAAYNNGYTVFAFDISNSNPSLFESVQSVYVELTVEFDTNTAATFYTNCVIVWDKALKIESNGVSVKLDRA